MGFKNDRPPNTEKKGKDKKKTTLKYTQSQSCLLPKREQSLGFECQYPIPRTESGMNLNHYSENLKMRMLISLLAYSLLKLKNENSALKIENSALKIENSNLSNENNKLKPQENPINNIPTDDAQAHVNDFGNFDPYEDFFNNFSI